MQFVNIRFPIIETGDSVEQRRAKMHEEVREYFVELLKPKISPTLAGCEAFDIIQTLFGYFMADMKRIETTAKGKCSEERAVELLQEWAGYLCDVHSEKIKRYADERGWTVPE